MYLCCGPTAPPLSMGAWRPHGDRRSPSGRPGCGFAHLHRAEQWYTAAPAISAAHLQKKDEAFQRPIRVGARGCGSVVSANVTFLSIIDFQPHPLARPGQPRLADWNNITTAVVVLLKTRVKSEQTSRGNGFGSQGVGGNSMHR